MLLIPKFVNMYFELVSLVHCSLFFDSTLFKVCRHSKKKKVRFLISGTELMNKDFGLTII